MKTRTRAVPLSRVLLLLTLFLLGLAAPALAGTGGPQMVWSKPLQNIADNLTGTTGRTIAIIMVVIGGMVWGFGRHEQGASRVGGIIVGIGLVLGASSFITTLGFEGATAAAPATRLEQAVDLLAGSGGRP
jgi:type IV secretory pathway VirB2 component (pilin)